MTGQEILNEILKSSQLRERLGIEEGQELKADLDSPSEYTEVAVVQDIINGNQRKTSEDNIFKTIRKLYNL